MLFILATSRPLYGGGSGVCVYAVYVYIVLRFVEINIVAGCGQPVQLCFTGPAGPLENAYQVVLGVHCEGPILIRVLQGCARLHIKLQVVAGCAQPVHFCLPAPSLWSFEDRNQVVLVVWNLLGDFCIVATKIPVNHRLLVSGYVHRRHIQVALAWMNVDQCQFPLLKR